MTKRKILVATTNPGKAAELKAMLDADVRWLSLADFPGVPEIKEDGTTFIENASKKAIGYAKATGLWTIADDSGLVIDALGGAPGIESASWMNAGYHASTIRIVGADRWNMKTYLFLMNDWLLPQMPFRKTVTYQELFCQLSGHF